MTSISKLTQNHRITLGQHGEDAAATYLETRGLRVIGRNWRCGRAGEVDLICQDGDTVVFVEVKTRHAGPLVDANLSISPQKLGRLKFMSQQWLIAHAGWQEYRIDLVAITVKSSPDHARTAHLEWHRGIDR